MTARRSLTANQRADIFLANGGICHLCGLKIVGKDWDVSHDMPLALGGEDGGDNRKVAHRKCHQDHTRTEDAPRIVKARRQRIKHVGADRPHKPFPGGKGSPWKRKIGGGTVRREAR